MFEVCSAAHNSLQPEIALARVRFENMSVTAVLRTQHSVGGQMNSRRGYAITSVMSDLHGRKIDTRGNVSVFLMIGRHRNPMQPQRTAAVRDDK